MEIYDDYCNWKAENEKYVSELLEKNSPVVSRFIHVYDVLEYYSNKIFAEERLDEEDEVIFSVGFRFLNEQISQIDILVNTYYNGDLQSMVHHSKAINLLLYTYDFQAEITEQNGNSQLLEDFADQVLKYIEKGEDVPDALFGVLNDITFKLFDGGEYFGIADVFYEIAEELDIIDDDEDVYEI